MDKKKLMFKILAIAVLVEIVYLVLVNLALSLPLTQKLINQHKPEKYAVYWDRAWSWHPFRVHARGISANGQSNTQQWQVNVTSASASIALLPILFKSIRIYNVEAQDVEYFQRPRPRKDKDYSSLQKFFPPIQGRELENTVPVPMPKKKGKAWKIVIDDAGARGSHRLWLFNMQAELSGELEADVIFQAPKGPFSLSDGMVNLSVDSFSLNDRQEISRKGRIKGELEISPFMPKENKGPKVLAYFDISAEIATEVESLKFLEFYLSRLYGMEIDGAGQLKGRLRYKEGVLLPKTSLVVSANELRMNVLDYKAEGRGDINIAVKPETPDDLHLGILFENIAAVYQDDEMAHFTGEGVEINTTGTSRLLPLDLLGKGTGYVSLSIRNAQVPDLSVYQRYIPAEKAIMLHGGQGTLEGEMKMTPKSFNAGISLASNNADISFQDYRFNTDLDVGVKANVPTFASGRVDISGTYLRMDDSRLANKKMDNQSQSWHTALTIEKGIMDLPIPAAEKGKDDVKSLSKALKGSDLKELLKKSDGEFMINGSVSDLAWINLLFTNPYNLSIGGSGNISADMRIAAGLPASGTELQASSRKLEIDILDYVATGDGQVSLKITGGGEQPDMDLSMKIEDASLKRSEEMESFINEVEMKLHAQGENLHFDGSDKLSELHLQIPSAKVTDMSIYDQYLPDKVPLVLAGGEGDLQADIFLKQDSADGYLRLSTEGMQLQWDEQDITADCKADINIAGGQPKDMIFDISGSRLLLDQVKVTGGENKFDDEDWFAHFYLGTGKTQWKKPVKVDAVAELEISDSRPVVAIFSNEKDSPAWLEKMLTTEDIEGTAEMNLEQRRLVIPEAFIKSEKIDVGAKGVMTDQKVEGTIYARYKKLDAILKIDNDKKKLGILRAKQKFDEYLPGQQENAEMESIGEREE